MSDGKLVFDAAESTTNTVTISQPSSTATRSGTRRRAVSRGAGCTTVDANAVTCAATGVTSVDADAKDGDDRITVTAATPACSTGGTGIDVLTGGAADDVFDGGNDPDVLAGLGGVDTVTYAARGGRVVVDIDGVADDGSSLRRSPRLRPRDNVKTDVENLTGGQVPRHADGVDARQHASTAATAATRSAGLGGVDTVTYAGADGAVVGRHRRRTRTTAAA